MFNPIALRMAKTLWSFRCSECKRIKSKLFSRVDSLSGKEILPKLSPL